MKKLFWDNPYQTELDTRVLSVSNNRVVFQETIGFSFSGGQESDKIFINERPVIHSEIKDDLIYYTLSDHHGLKPFDKVSMRIDWTRRYKLMRLHFAAELILELMLRRLPIEKIGAHIAETKARIDFKINQNIALYFDELLSEYHKIITSDLIIKTGFSEVVTQRRYWEIEGFAKVPCGGTHVKSTAEVGDISLKRINIGAGKERVEIKLLSA